MGSFLLLFLRWSTYSFVAGTPCSPFLVQHHLGCHQEGSRALEFLHRGASDPETFCRRIHPFVHLHLRDGDPGYHDPPSCLENPRLRLVCHSTSSYSCRMSHPFSDHPESVPHDFLVLSQERSHNHAYSLGFLSSFLAGRTYDTPDTFIYTNTISTQIPRTYCLFMQPLSVRRSFIRRSC